MMVMLFEKNCFIFMSRLENRKRSAFSETYQKAVRKCDIMHKDNCN